MGCASSIPVVPRPPSARFASSAAEAAVAASIRNSFPSTPEDDVLDDFNNNNASSRMANNNNAAGGGGGLSSRSNSSNNVATTCPEPPEFDLVGGHVLISWKILGVFDQPSSYMLEKWDSKTKIFTPVYLGANLEFSHPLEAGMFKYRVQAIYASGARSPWSQEGHLAVPTINTGIGNSGNNNNSSNSGGNSSSGLHLFIGNNNNNNNSSNHIHQYSPTIAPARPYSSSGLSQQQQHNNNSNNTAGSPPTTTMGRNNNNSSSFHFAEAVSNISSLSRPGTASSESGAGASGSISLVSGNNTTNFILPVAAMLNSSSSATSPPTNSPNPQAHFSSGAIINSIANLNSSSSNSSSGGSTLSGGVLISSSTPGVSGVRSSIVTGGSASGTSAAPLAHSPSASSSLIHGRQAPGAAAASPPPISPPPSWSQQQQQQQQQSATSPQQHLRQSLELNNTNNSSSNNHIIIPSSSPSPLPDSNFNHYIVGSSNPSSPSSPPNVQHSASSGNNSSNYATTEPFSAGAVHAPTWIPHFIEQRPLSTTSILLAWDPLPALSKSFSGANVSSSGNFGGGGGSSGNLQLSTSLKSNPSLSSPPPSSSSAPAAGANGFQPFEFVLEVGSANGQPMQAVYRGHKPRFVCEVRSGFQVRARVCAANAGGLGPWSDVISVDLSAAPLPAPTAPTFADVSAQALTLEWLPPSAAEMQNQQQNQQFQYVLQMADRTDGNGFHSIYCGSALSYRVTDLPLGHQVVFRVQARVNGRHSRWSATAMFVAASGCPDAVDVPEIASLSPTSIQLKWNPPANNGSDILEFVVRRYLSRGGSAVGGGGGSNNNNNNNNNNGWEEVFRGLAVSCVVNDLILGETYQFRISAVNAVGEGEPGPACCFATAITKPGIPEAPEITSAASNSVQLSWSTAQSLENLEYHVQCRLDTNTAAPPPVASSADDGGIKLRTSSRSLLIVPDRKDYIGEENGDDDDDEVELGDDDDDDDESIDEDIRYEVDDDEEEESTSSSAKDAVTLLPPASTFSGLRNPIAATAAQGERKSTTTSGGMMAVGNGNNNKSSSNDSLRPISRETTASPGAISTLSFSGGIGSMSKSDESSSSPDHMARNPGIRRLDFNNTNNNGTHQINITVNPTGSAGNDEEEGWFDVYRGRDTSCLVDKLELGKDYLFRLRVRNAAGWSAWSDNLFYIPIAGPPLKPLPVCVSTTGLSTSACIEWQAPDCNGAEITHYQLEMDTMDGGTGSGVPVIVDTGLRTSEDLNALIPGCLYRFRVRAVNEAGEGDWSDITTFETNPIDFPGANIDYNELEFAEPLGEGAFAVVSRASWRGRDVAVKKLKVQYLSEDYLESFRKEITLLSSLRHPNIVQYIGACTQRPHLCVITELMAKGSLADILYKQKIHLPLDRALSIAMDVAKGMRHLHSLEPMIIHRDLKATNILVDDSWNARIADFGLSRMKSEASQISGMLGTPGWSAPEIYKQEKYNEKVDIYSYGVVLSELISGERPYAGLNAMQIAFATVYQGMRPTIPDSCPPALRNLIKNCWDSIPSKRPSWEKILEVLKKSKAKAIERGERTIRHRTSRHSSQQEEEEKGEKTRGGGGGGKKALPARLPRLRGMASSTAAAGDGTGGSATRSARQSVRPRPAAPGPPSPTARDIAAMKAAAAAAAAAQQDDPNQQPSLFSDDENIATQTPTGVTVAAGVVVQQQQPQMRIRGRGLGSAGGGGGAGFSVIPSSAKENNGNNINNNNGSNNTTGLPSISSSPLLGPGRFSPSRKSSTVSSTPFRI